MYEYCYIEWALNTHQSFSRYFKNFDETDWYMCTVTVQLRHWKIITGEKFSSWLCWMYCRLSSPDQMTQMWHFHISRFWGRDWRSGSPRGQCGGQSGAPGPGEAALGGEVNHWEVRRHQGPASGVPELVDTDSEPTPGKQQTSAARLRPQTGEGSAVQKGDFFFCKLRLKNCNKENSDSICQMSDTLHFLWSDEESEHCQWNQSAELAKKTRWYEIATLFFLLFPVLFHIKS